MQSKTSLWAFCCALFCWLLLRILLNLPDFSAKSERKSEVQIVRGDRSAPIFSTVNASQVGHAVAKLPIQKPRAGKMILQKQEEYRQSTRFHQHVLPLLASTARQEPDEPHLVLMPIQLGSSINTSSQQSPNSSPFSVSGWLLLRSKGSNQNIATGGQLAGSQVGMKLAAELLTFHRRLSLTGYVRGSSALRPVEAGEAAVGVSMKHSSGRLSSAVLVERRIKLSDGGRNDFVLVGSTSVYDLPIAPLVTLEGYAQAGVVGLKRRDLFVDASLRVNRRLIKTTNSELSVGAGIWAATQSSVNRVDVGPQMTFKQQISGGAFRISGEWRFRLRGNARPNSGPAVTAGFDF